MPAGRRWHLDRLATGALASAIAAGKPAGCTAGVGGAGAGGVNVEVDIQVASRGKSRTPCRRAPRVEGPCAGCGVVARPRSGVYLWDSRWLSPSQYGELPSVSTQPTRPWCSCHPKPHAAGFVPGARLVRLPQVGAAASHRSHPQRPQRPERLQQPGRSGSAGSAAQNPGPRRRRCAPWP